MDMTAWGMWAQVTLIQKSPRALQTLETLHSLQSDNTESSELVLPEITIVITLTFSAIMDSRLFSLC